MAKAGYGTMIQVRSIIVRSAAYNLGKAVTIGVRYCCVRRQTKHDDAKLETQVRAFFFCVAQQAYVVRYV